MASPLENMTVKGSKMTTVGFLNCLYVGRKKKEALFNYIFFILYLLMTFLLEFVFRLKPEGIPVLFHTLGSP